MWRFSQKRNVDRFRRRRRSAGYDLKFDAMLLCGVALLAVLLFVSHYNRRNAPWIDIATKVPTRSMSREQQSTHVPKHVRRLLSSNYSRQIPPRHEWLQDPTAAYPVREVLSRRQMCPDDEDINLWIRARTLRWLKPGYTEEHNIWQTAINDKLGGYLFARKMGVRVPRIDFCSGNGPGALQHYLPRTDRGFVVKNLHGYSSKNVYVLESGFGGVNLIDQRVTSLEDIQNALTKANTSDVYVEELIERQTGGGAVPDEYKFFAANGRVACLGVFRNRGTDRACTAFYDENWNRLDQFGCFLYVNDKPKQGNRTDSETGCYALQYGDSHDKRRFCSDIAPPNSFPKMLETVKRLSERIGIFMRIDMFEDARGDVFVGEFTPFHAFGKFHCAASIVNGCIDSCFLGRFWKENSLVDGETYDYEEGWDKRKDDSKFAKRALPHLEGGRHTSAPDYLKDWCKLSMTEKCARIRDV